eukprot:s4265_g1.t1
MYYERSLTNLALALLPPFAALLTEERRANGGEMLPGGAMSELIGRIGALQLITKDQIMNLAVELLPPANGGEMLPGGAMSELIGRIGALQLITKDQIMNLAVELLPPQPELENS